MDPVKYRADDVRSSELETRLSSNAESLNKVVDTTASKLPSSSSSRPLHAVFEYCSLKESHLKGFRKRFQFPKGTSIRLPRLGEKACNFAHRVVCLQPSFSGSYIHHTAFKQISNRPRSTCLQCLEDDHKLYVNLGVYL